MIVIKDSDLTAEELREALDYGPKTRQNLANSRLRNNNTSGAKGIWFDQSRNKWAAIAEYGPVARVP